MQQLSDNISSTETDLRCFADTAFYALLTIQARSKHTENPICTNTTKGGSKRKMEDISPKQKKTSTDPLFHTNYYEDCFKSSRPLNEKNIFLQKLW